MINFGETFKLYFSSLPGLHFLYITAILMHLLQLLFLVMHYALSLRPSLRRVSIAFLWGLPHIRPGRVLLPVQIPAADMPLFTVLLLFRIIFDTLIV